MSKLEIEANDNDICFCFTFYNEIELSKKLISQLQNFYPSSNIICISDGNSNLELEKFCDHHNINYIKGERLFNLKYGGLWVKRMLLTYLENSSSNYLIKLDPDVLIRRKFKYFPDTDLAGDITYHSNFKFIHGAPRFHKREACKAILDSNLLESPKYILDLNFAYRPHYKTYLTPKQEYNCELFISEDKIICDVAQQLNLKLGQWNEVYSRIPSYCPEPAKYATIHPVKY